MLRPIGARVGRHQLFHEHSFLLGQLNEVLSLLLSTAVLSYAGHPLLNLHGRVCILTQSLLLGRWQRWVALGLLTSEHGGVVTLVHVLQLRCAHMGGGRRHNVTAFFGNRCEADPFYLEML